MVKYKSRINSIAKTVKKSPLKKKVKTMSTTLNEASRTELFTNGVEGGSLSVGGNLPAVGGSIPVGGKIKKVLDNKLSKESSLNKLDVMGDGEIENMDYNNMNHVLGSMDNDQFHMLQGIAGGFLGASHPLSSVMMDHLGGSFDHPIDVSKLATRDILKSMSSAHLANALHSEAVDNRRGLETGGGLLDSLKKAFKKGVSGVKAVARNPRGTLKAATHIGSRLNSALKKGIGIAKLLEPSLPIVGPILKAAEAVQPSIEKAISITEQLESALGSADEPLVQMA